MRKKRNQQCSLNFIDTHHEIHEVLSGVSQWLDADPCRETFGTSTWIQ